MWGMLMDEACVFVSSKPDLFAAFFIGTIQLIVA